MIARNICAGPGTKDECGHDNGYESAATGGLPDMKISVRQVFGIDSDMEAPAYSSADSACSIQYPGLSLRSRYYPRHSGRALLSIAG